ncbi:flagellar basal body protein, partial [Klebsiella pneumoniae]
MNLTTAIRASASGLTAERMRMDVISANIANASSVETRTTQPF